MTMRLAVRRRTKSLLVSYAEDAHSVIPLLFSKESPSLFQTTGDTGDATVSMSIKSQGVLSLGVILDLNKS